jgi:hypothetical protein
MPTHHLLSVAAVRLAGLARLKEEPTAPLT